MRLLAVSLSGLSILGLVGCSSDSDPAPALSPAKLRVVHASPDAPAVDVSVGGQSIAKGAGYKAATAFQEVSAGMQTVKITVAGTSTTALSAPVDLPSGGYTTVLALNKVAALEPLVIQEGSGAPDMGKARVRVVHAASDVPAVDVYVTAPGADLATLAPTLAKVPFKVFSDGLQVPAATYQIRVTASGSKAPVYDSGSVALDAGTDLVTVAVPKEVGASPVTLLTLTRSASAPSLELVDTRALVRVKHLSPDAPAVDVLVNGQVALTKVSFPVVSDYLALPSGTQTFNVNAAGTATSVLQAALPLKATQAYSVLAVNFLQKLEAWVLEDDLRAPGAGKAKLRVIHASPDAPAVDVYVNGAKVLEKVPFKTASAYLEVPKGTHDVAVRVSGTDTTVLRADVMAAEGRIYSAVARGSLQGVNGKALGLSLLTDK